MIHIKKLLFQNEKLKKQFRSLIEINPDERKNIIEKNKITHIFSNCIICILKRNEYNLFLNLNDYIMNRFIKITVFITSIALIWSSLSINVQAYNNWELDAANILASQKIINNHSDSPLLYNLDNNVLRQEVAAVVRGVTWLDKKTSCNSIFWDVFTTEPNNWACFSVEALLDAWFIAKNTYFNPERNISKAEALGMMINAAGLDYTYNADTWTSWQKQVTTFAADLDIVSEFTDYDTLATRWWIFKIAVASMNSLSIDEENILEDIFWWFDNEVD